LDILVDIPHQPHSGELFLFDRSITRKYKCDGYEWIKKRNSKKVREDHVKLMLNGRHRIAGVYSHCSNPRTLHRRAYRLLDPENKNTMPMANDSKENDEKTKKNGKKPSVLILVHYLDFIEAANAACGTMGNVSCFAQIRDEKKSGMEQSQSESCDSIQTSNKIKQNCTQKQEYSEMENFMFERKSKPYLPNTSATASHLASFYSEDEKRNEELQKEILDILWAMVMNDSFVIINDRIVIQRSTSTNLETLEQLKLRYGMDFF